MIDLQMFALYLAPALGLVFAAILYISTIRSDRNALERADAEERRTAQG